MAKLSRQVNTGWRGDVGQFEIHVTVDGRGGIATVMPEDGEIYDVMVEARANDAGGTMQVHQAGNDITNAIACDAAGAKTHAGTIDRDHSNLSRGDNVNVTTNQADARGRVVIKYVPR